MKRLLVILMTGLLSLSVATANPIPHHHKNVRYYVLANGDVVKVKDKDNRVVVKTYTYGYKTAKVKAYYNGQTEVKFY